MSDLPAFCFYKTFDPEPPKMFRTDRHYLLYASEGSLRLITDDRCWTLPPSRAAWIAANDPILVEIPRPATCCSVLFAEGFVPPPTPSGVVFDMSPMAREMVLECRAFGPESEGLSDYAMQLFRTLGLTCHELARRPANSWVPIGKSDAAKRALDYTEARLDQDIGFASVADAAHLSERTLARRFADELGMTWRQAQRRMRMVRAIEMLAQDTQITQIALNTGYNSLSAFNAAFKDFTGQTPTEYRANSRANPEFSFPNEPAIVPPN